MTGLRKMIAMLAGRCRAPGLLSDFAHSIRTLQILFDPYRPELHYMRGPGPKWHAKHDPVMKARMRAHSISSPVAADPKWAPSIGPKNVADDTLRGYAGIG
jgi:hypothetical protein